MKEIADILGWRPVAGKSNYIAYFTEENHAVPRYVVDKMDALTLEEIPTRLEHEYWKRDPNGALDWHTVWFIYVRMIVPYLAKRLELGI